MCKTDKELKRWVKDRGSGFKIGEIFKFDTIRIVLKKNDEDEYVESKRVMCMSCFNFMSHADGSHVRRHVTKTCKKPRATSEPLEASEPNDSIEPPMKCRRIDDFSVKIFTRSQLEGISRTIARYSVRSGRSFNHLSSDSFKMLVIELYNQISKGYATEARNQLPSRNTIMRHSLEISDNIINKAYSLIEPFIAEGRVQLMCDHGKIVTNYLSLVASFIDDSFKLQMLPIGFVPVPDGKSGAETYELICERLGEFGWSREQVSMLTCTADGALRTLGSHFAMYIRCCSHSLNLVAQRSVKPTEHLKCLLSSDELEDLNNVESLLKAAQTVSTSVRINSRACRGLSRLPNLPSETRWLNDVCCLKDILDLAEELTKVSTHLTQRGRQALNFLLFEKKRTAKAVLDLMEPLLFYTKVFQDQTQVQLQLVLPAYKRLREVWSAVVERPQDNGDSDEDASDYRVVRTLAKSGINAIDYYYQEFGDVHRAAVLLNPKTKKMLKFDITERLSAETYVMNLIARSESAVKGCHESKSIVTIPSFLQDLNDGVNEENPSLDEMQRYLAEPVDFNSNETVELYWSRKRNEFPDLYSAATRIFSTVPSEASCESMFSVAGYLLDKTRTRLQCTSAERVILGSQLAAKFPNWL